MKEFILTFEKDGKQYSIRRYLSPEIAAKSIVWASIKRVDSKGVMLASCEEITGVTAKDFIKSII